MSMAAVLVLLVIGLPWLGALLVWRTGNTRPRVQHALAACFSMAGGVASLALLVLVAAQPALDHSFGVEMGPGFGRFNFTPDGLGTFLTVVASVIGSLAVIFSIDYMKGEKQLGRYYALVLFFIGSMAGLVLTGNLLLMFVFWEMTALTSYALISFYNDDPKAVAGGMKALIMTQLGGVGLLLGALIAYAYAGTFDIRAMMASAENLPPDVLAVMAFGFLVAAAAKSAQFPFQTWLPDAMEAPTPVSALIHAATMVNAGVYLLARFYPMFAEVPMWREWVMAVGVVTALLAALMALAATDLKRVLAYSTVSQLGYMVYAVGAGGIFASQYHLLSHSVFKALLFLGAGAVIHSVGTRDMRKMGAAVGAQMPAVRVVFIIGAAALAGLPILNGFWSKEMVLEAGLAHGPAWMFGVMVFSAGLTALYTFRCVWMTFFARKGEDEHIHLHDAGTAMRAALYPLALGTLTTWLLAGPFGHLLAESLPLHEIEAHGTLAVMEEVVLAPATWLAMAVVALGLLAWVFRAKLELISEPLQSIRWLADSSFGFEAVNQTVVKEVLAWSEGLRGVQTGHLAWNVVGIIAGLMVVLLIVMLGA